MPEEFRKGANAEAPEAGPFLARVVSHLDPTYMGTLEVQILHESGNDEDREGQLRTVKYLNPFYGSTHIDYVSEDADTHDNTQKAYGMWAIPPDVGTIVVVIFIGGDTRKGFWMGCVQNEDMNFSLPGYAATEFVVDDSRETDSEKTRVPVSEYNKVIHPSTESDSTKKLKPEHPSAVALESQGLLKDDIRGITTSSARREVPSMVFGISTPGPIDKEGKQGKVGKHEHKIPNAFVSRLGGSSFVMDDGDDKFLRKTTASDGPPEYASVELDETDGLKNILHNELIRLRTRTGHQILMHNSEDLIYICNSRGTAWIELTSDGKIDIYAEDSISFRTKQDFNFYADRDINMEAGRNFNTKVNGRKHTHVVGDQTLIVDANQKIRVTGTHDTTVTGVAKVKASAGFNLNTTGENNFTASGTTNIKSGGNHVETASQIHMNGPAAETADSATPPDALSVHTHVDLPGQDQWESTTSKTSIMRRIPTPEPYPHHENLDPLRYKPDMLDRDAGSSDMSTPPDAWRKYSTITDTFAKVPAANQDTGEE
jgi:hypothetical protein